MTSDEKNENASAVILALKTDVERNSPPPFPEINVTHSGFLVLLTEKQSDMRKWGCAAPPLYNEAMIQYSISRLEKFDTK